MKYTVGKDKETIKELDRIHAQKEEEAGSPLKRKKDKVPVTVKAKVTKRPQVKILEKIRIKIIQSLQK